MRMHIGRFGAGLLLLSLLAGAGGGITISSLGSTAAGATTTITVNDFSDGTGPYNCTPGAEGDCTLRAALAEATTLDEAVTISVPAGSYVVSAVTGPLEVADSGGTVTIDGAGQATTILDLQCPDGPCTIDTNVLTVEGDGTADISGVTITGGNNTATSGGGIINDGTLTLADSTVAENTTSASGGGIAQTEGETSLTLNDDTISDNTAGSDGGGVYANDGTVTITGGTIGGTGSTTPLDQGNTAADSGGGLSLEGAAGTISGVTFGGTNTTQGNSAGEDGGAIYMNGGDPSFSGDTITNNSAVEAGGGIAIDGGTNTFTNETIENNTAGVAATNNGDGGGIFVEEGTNTFTDDTVNDNTAIWVSEDDGYGGGLDVSGGAIVTFTGGSLDSNQAYGGGGFAIFSGTINVSQADISSNNVTEGAGGVLLDGGTTSITQSTISNNAVTEAIGITEFVGDGGGIVSDFCNPLTLTNDTIVNNSATLLGGAYFGTACSEPSSDDSTTFLFDTISGNSAGEGGGNINTDDQSLLDIGNSIVANGVSGGVEGDNCTFTGGGTLTSQGYNLIDDSTCGTPGTGDIIGQNPQLGALGNNGGPTQTELPATSSPAVSAIPAAVCSASGVSTDQRGNARGAGTNGSCTIGAVEVAPAAPPSYNPNGYRMVADEGGIFDFGLNFNGSLANNKLNAPIVGLANSPGPNGYVMVASDGGVFALGGANFYGSLGGQNLPSPIAAIAAPTAETGYWLVAQNGKIYNFGSVPPLPALSLPPGAHIVGMASDNSGQGAWLVDQLGDVYAEGDATYEGGLGGVHINAPIVGIAAAASGQGYVLVASDGGVFNYKMGFYGSVPGSLAPGQKLVAPIVGIAVTHSGNGYWEVGADGGLFDYGDAPFLGSVYTAIPGKKLNGPIVGIQHLGSVPPG